MKMIRSETIEGFHRILEFARSYWRLWLVAVLFMFIYSAAMGARLALVKPIIDRLTEDRTHSELSLPEVGHQKNGPQVQWKQRLKEKVKDIPGVAWVKAQTGSFKGIGLLAIALTPVIFIANYIYGYLLQKIILKVNVDISNHICNRLIYQPIGFFEKSKSGELISRIINDIGSVQKIMSSSDVMILPLKLLTGLALALYFSWKLLLLCLLIIPFPMVMAAYFGKRAKKYGRDSLVRRGRLTEALREIFSGIRVIRAYRMEEDRSREFREINKELLKKRMKVNRNVILNESTTEALYTFGLGIAILAIGYAITSSSISLGELGGFAAACALVFSSSKKLSKQYTKLQVPMAGVSRTFEFLDHLSVVEDPPGAAATKEVKRDITFRNVSFAYDSQAVLKDISFTARKGETIAIVGESGVGKTTLLNLMPRFYEPLRGSIEIDGQDICNIKRTSLLELVAIVTQHTFLFNRSIAENIECGKKGAGIEEIEEAARAAHIHDFISVLPRRYDTNIGELGMRLSAGQRQRIAIARAFLKNAPILILDEATSALDSESEKLIQEALNQLMKEKTTFVVAHRLSSLKYCNKIIVLKKGEIVEMGTHEELIVKEGEYWRLYQEQMNKKATTTPSGSSSQSVH